MCERYSGYANRETWCAGLWIDNEESLYRAYSEALRTAYTEALRAELESDPADTKEAHRLAVHAAAAALREWWEETFDADSDALADADKLQILRDVGSEYRIDWTELTAARLADDADEIRAAVLAELAADALDCPAGCVSHETGCLADDGGSPADARYA